MAAPYMRGADPPTFPVRTPAAPVTSSTADSHQADVWLDSSVILPSGSMMPAKPHKSNGASVSSPSTPAAPVAGPSSTRSLGNGSSEITHAKQRTSQTPGIRNGSTRPRKQVGRGRAVADHDHGPARKRTKLAAEIPGTSLKPQVYVHGELGGSLPAVEDPTYLRCGWKNCREAFWTLDDLTEHLHGPQGHVSPVQKGQTMYCEWTGCHWQGRLIGGRPQLITHLRMHTSEKASPCPNMVCTKAFSRADALAKHMQSAHSEGPARPSSEVRSHESRDTATAIDDVVDLDASGSRPKDTKDAKRIEEDTRAAEEQALRKDLQKRFPTKDIRYLEYIVTLAKYKFVVGERTRIRAEHKAVLGKERAMRLEVDHRLDDVVLQRLGTDAQSYLSTTIEKLSAEPE